MGYDPRGHKESNTIEEMAEHARRHPSLNPPSKPSLLQVSHTDDVHSQLSAFSCTVSPPPLNLLKPAVTFKAQAEQSDFKKHSVLKSGGFQHFF